MEKKEIFEKVAEVFVDVLDDESIVLTPETTAEDVPDWDSLTHIRLVVAVEKKFKIRFSSEEIVRWKNVGEMVECIQAKF